MIDLGERFDRTKYLMAILSLVSMFALTDIASAQEVRDALRECAAEKNDAKRLSCYDGLAGRQVERQPVAKTAPKSGPSAPPQTKAAPNLVPQVAVNAETTFGLSAEQMQKPEGGAALKRIESKVAKLETRARGRLVVTLENEQVWEQLNPDSTFMLELGDPVTIKTGALGAFYLVGRSNRTTNVRRMR